MFVSQSTLSAGLRELESLLGVTLVERSRRVVRFTPLGNAVVKKAHRLLREAEELSDLVQASGKPLSGELRMSVIPTIAPFFLPRILPRLRVPRPSRRAGGRAFRMQLRRAPLRRLRHGRATRSARGYPAGDDRRRPSAAAGRRPLPLGAYLGCLQPARIARFGGDDRHI